MAICNPEAEVLRLHDIIFNKNFWTLKQIRAAMLCCNENHQKVAIQSTEMEGFDQVEKLLYYKH